MPKSEIKDKSDVIRFVNEFYQRVRKDDLIGPIFESRIKDRWPMHLEKMYNFWNTVLFSSMEYSGHPFSPHATMPLDSTHFERWIDIMQSTLKDNFKGEKAEEIAWRAERMAQMFQIKLDHIKQGGLKHIV